MDVDVEIFVHGVPNGESFFGKDEDRNYFGNFYDQSCSDKVRFLVQTRSSNGKKYSYYNYLVYSNVVGNDGRSGSYFGLSIRFDAYCKDFMAVYKVLDVVFCTDIVNNILKMQYGNYKYIIQDFITAADVLKKMQSRTCELIQSALKPESFCPLNSFNANGSQHPSANLYEITSSEVEDTVRQYGKIAVSPYYQTKNERTLAQNYEAKLNKEKQQCEDRIRANATASENRLTQKENELSSLRTDNSKLERKNEDQKKEIEKLKGKIREIDSTQKSNAIIEKIKEPIMELASIIGYKDWSNPNEVHKGKSPSYMRSVIPWINTILGVIIISMLMFSSKENTEKTNDALNDSINMLKYENENLKYQIQTVGESNGDVTTNAANSYFGNGSHDATDLSSKSAKIDVSDYNEKRGIYLKVGQSHKASILNANNPDNQNWTIDGGEIKENRGNVVIFIPKSEKVTLKYIDSNGEYKERELKAIKE